MHVFIKLVGDHPTLLLKLITSTVFLTLGVLIMLHIIELNAGGNTQYLYGGLIMVYGMYRLYTFYSEYKERKNEIRQNM